MKKLYLCCALLSLCSTIKSQENSSQRVKKNKGLTVLLKEPVATPYVVERTTLKLKSEVAEPAPVAQVPQKSSYQNIKETMGSYLTQLYGYLPNVRLRK